MAVKRSVRLCFVILLFLSLTTVEAAHPHPNATEEVHAYHRRLRRTYPTRYIHSALCADVSYERCLAMEHEMKENARTLQSIFNTDGFFRVLVVLVRFLDHADRVLPPVADYIELFNGEGTSDIIPTGSIRQYMTANSNGKLQFEAEVVDWTLSDNTELYYSFNKSGLDVDLRKSMYPALDRLESEGFDFSRFDQNGDGVIDNLIILHSGYAAEVGGVDCDTNRGHQQRIWAHAIGSNDQNWVSPSSGIRASGYSVSSGLRGTCFSLLSRISVIAHEYLHTLGLPDLNDGAGDYIGRGMGDWDVMSNAHGRDGAQLNPAHLSPWSKMEVGWLTPIEITENGVYSIEASEVSTQVYVIRDPYPNGEYLIIENRQPMLWDVLLWSGGLLIWHHDERQDMLMNRGYPLLNGWPGNGVHYAIAVAAADGKYDLEVGNNGGDDLDYWRDGAVFGPGPVEDQATDAGVYPNTNSYQGGNIQQTGLVIDQISSSSTIMTFRVSGLLNAAEPTSVPTAEPTSIPTAAPVSLPPTLNPTSRPSSNPTYVSSLAPSTTAKPSLSPSVSPTITTSPSKTRVSNVFAGFQPSSDEYDPIGYAMHTASPTVISDASQMTASSFLCLLVGLFVVVPLLT